jgi:hypothetical protein
MLGKLGRLGRVGRFSLLSSVALFSPISLFSANEPGVWYDPSDVANLDWRRNLLTFTEQFDNAVWNKTIGGLSNTLTPNTILAPDSTLTADTINFMSGTDKWIGYDPDITLAAGQTYTFSVWLRRASGSSQIRLNINPYALSWIDVTVTSAWTRVSITQTSATTTTPAQTCGILAANSSSDQIYVWGAQLELGSTATEYQRITDVNTEVIQRFPSATLYQDTAGTIPVTGPTKSDGTPVTVALALDKSKGLVLGSENLSGWSNGATFPLSVFSASGSGFTAEKNATSVQVALSNSFSVVSGRSYRVDLAIAYTTSSAPTSRYWNLSFVSAEAGTSRSVGTITLPNTGSPTAFSGVLEANFTGTVFLQLAVTNSLMTGTIGLSSVSVKELPGFHATQATAGSRPIYGIVPVGGRRNLLTFTEQFDNAAWVKAQTTVTANAATAPDGTLTADRIVETATTNAHGVYAAFTYGSGLTYTATVYAKAAERSWVYLGADTAAGEAVFFDLSGSGAVGSAGTGYTGTITSVGNGWFRCQVVFAQATALPPNFFVVGASTGNGTTSYAGNASNGILIWGAQLETGSTATAYQRVVSQYDVTEAGVPSVSYLQFDTSKFLVTPTITPGIDKAQVFAGVRKLSDAAAGILLESGGSISTNNGIYLSAPQSNLASERYGFFSRGSAPLALGQGSFANAGTAPDIAVISGLGDIAADTSIIRRNGTAFAAGSADQGTGNYSAQPLYIGMRAGASLPFNGQLYSLIVRFGANLTTDTITSTETWVAGKTGITL